MELQPGESLAQLIVNLPGYADALVLANLLEMHRQRPQLPVRQAELLLGAFALRAFTRFAQSSVHRGHEPRQALLQDIVGSSFLEGFNGYLLAEGAGDENEGNVRALFAGEGQSGVTVK